MPSLWTPQGERAVAERKPGTSSGPAIEALKQAARDCPPNGGANIPKPMLVALVAEIEALESAVVPDDKPRPPKAKRGYLRPVG
jgi:hypothetical protein